MTAPAIERFLGELRSDPAVWARAPCGHEYRLADSELFNGADLTPAARVFVELQRGVLRDLDAKAQARRHNLTDGFVQRSVEVKFGKTMEKIVPVLQGFPYDAGDCRAMFDPIDYVAFVGASGGAVSRVDFIDIKTGAAQLTQVQRQIRDAVEDGKVRVHRIGG